MPMPTNAPKNGIVIQSGGSFEFALSSRLRSSGVTMCLRRMISGDLADAGENALGVAAFLEGRRELLADDLPGQAVGENRLEPVADLDPHLALARARRE